MLDYWDLRRPTVADSAALEAILKQINARGGRTPWILDLAMTFTGIGGTPVFSYDAAMDIVPGNEPIYVVSTSADDAPGAGGMESVDLLTFNSQGEPTIINTELDGLTRVLVAQAGEVSQVIAARGRDYTLVNGSNSGQISFTNPLGIDTYLQIQQFNRTITRMRVSCPPDHGVVISRESSVLATTNTTPLGTGAGFGFNIARCNGNDVEKHLAWYSSLLSGPLVNQIPAPLRESDGVLYYIVHGPSGDLSITTQLVIYAI